MFDFGDELTIDSYKIPWIFWIQVLVLFLLFFLLYCFSLFSSDLPSTTACSSSSAPPSLSSHLEKTFLNLTTTTNHRLQHSQIGEIQSIKGEIATNTSRRIVHEDNLERESILSDYHPCNYFRLAKLAFLKCLGFDCTSENSKRSGPKKER